jgi:hypothetical protein
VRLTLPACLCVLSLLPLWGSLCRGEDPPAPSARQVEELIRQLGSPKFPEREAATRKLMDLPAAAPALRKLARSPDADAARQANRILDGLARKRVGPLRDLLKAAAKDGRADLLTERVVRWPGEQADPDCWQPAVEFAAKVAELDWKGEKWARMTEKNNPFADMPLKDFRRYVERAKPTVLPRNSPELRSTPGRWYEGAHIYRGEQFTAGKSSAELGCLVATSGGVRVHRFCASTVLANGQLTAHDCSRSVIICDGDIEIQSGLSFCVVVARGAVKCPYPVSVTESLILAREVHFPVGFNGQKSTIKAAGAVHKHPRDNSLRETVIEQNVANVFDFVKFFETADVGVGVAATEKGVRVEDVAGGKPFAKAGFRKGDVVVTVDGDKPDSPESFRRLLRRAVVQGDGTFEVRRGDKVLELTVLFPD